MTKDQLLTKLCCNDKRNPDTMLFGDEPQQVDHDCACDNCFYGRKELAEFALKLLAEATY